MAAATLFRLALISSAAAATLSAREDVSLALSVIMLAISASSDEERSTWAELAEIFLYHALQFFQKGIEPSGQFGDFILGLNLDTHWSGPLRPRRYPES